MAMGRDGIDPESEGRTGGVQPCGACPVKWHVIATEYQQEPVAQRAMQELGFATLLPLIRKRTPATKARPARTILSPAFPGYLFAAWRASDEWGRARRGSGVQAVLTRVGGDTPAEVPSAFLDALRARMDGVGVLQDLSVPDILPALPAMIAVRITGGPLAGQRGIVEWSTEERVALLLHVLGGFHRAQMRRDHVEPDQ